MKLKWSKAGYGLAMEDVSKKSGTVEGPDSSGWRQ